MKGNFFSNFFENPSGIQFVHRNLAIVIVLVVCFIWYRSNRLKLSKPQQVGITLIIYGIFIQFILGVLTLIYQVPLVMGALHQTGAFFLFTASIYLLFHLFNRNAQASERIS
jgi:cytochrome c oxidase assembly protein subunit 15